MPLEQAAEAASEHPHWYVLNRTALGRHIYAVGDDPDAARLAGIRTDKVLFSVYVAAGVICALGAWALIGRIGSISPQAGQTANLDSITAVVIGGASLFGGRGSIVGTLIGALIVGVSRSGLALSGVDVLSVPLDGGGEVGWNRAEGMPVRIQTSGVRSAHQQGVAPGGPGKHESAVGGCAARRSA